MNSLINIDRPRGPRATWRFALAPISAALLLSAGHAHAADWFEDTYVAPMLSYAIADDKRHTKDGLGGTLGLGWKLSEVTELELRGTYLKYKSNDDEYACGLLNLDSCPYGSDKIGGGGVGFNYFLANWGKGGPYLHADIMATDEDGLAHAGLGWDFAFGDSGFALRAEALLQADINDDYREPLFNLGLRIPLGPQSKLTVPEPIPEPVRVVEPVAPPPPPPPPPCTMLPDGSIIDFSGCKTGDTVVLRGVNFDFDKSSLTVNAKNLLDGVATALQQRADIKVEVDGHTDAKGSDAYNQALSDRRAKSVVKYLTGKGIAKERMVPKGFGESAPIADNATDEGRELNRRVELKVLESSGGVTVEQAGKPDETIPPVAGPAEAPPSTEVAPPAAAPVEALPAPAPAAESHEGMSMAPAAAAEAPAAAPAGGTAVSIENMAFTPPTLTVAVGATVTFTNNDGSNHIIAFTDGTASPRLPMGKSYTRTFTAPGEYPYVCRIHPQMSGKIVVQ